MTCIQCGNTFVFSVAEQERCIAHRFDKPKRCPQCRKNRVRGIEIDNGIKGKNKKKHRRPMYDYEAY